MDDRPEVEIRLLGEVEVTVAGRPVEIGSVKQRALLAALALRPGAVVSSDQLVGLLWRHDPPESARVTLRSLVYRLRKQLAPVELGAEGPGYVLAVSREAVDALRFERLIASARDAVDPEGAVASLQAALALWRGPALESVDPLDTEARRLDELRLSTVESLAGLELDLGRTEDAVARLETHLAAHPLREAAWGRLMLGLYRLGRQAEALERYQRIRRLLDSELGIEPTPALRELETAILQHRPELMPRGREANAEFTETLAFLFTDIQASTRRWEGDRDAMALDLERHDDLLGGACRRQGGEVFSHTGDGLCAAFSTAAAAVGAAVEGQLLLDKEYGGRADALRVRMALHAGVVQRRAGNYFGPTLNRAARLLGVSWGGQIICSSAVADLAADHLPERVSLRDLGEHRLTDLVRSERVFQVLHAELPAEFPPLRGGGGVRHNLPPARTSFVGRAAEIAELNEALRRARLVTLAGPGGAGKTRLALEVGAACADRYPDGAWFVELARVQDPDLVANAVAVGAGLDQGALTLAGVPFLTAVCEALARRTVVLILDNCEHVVAAASTVAHELLSRCSGVTVLATSREPLAVPGESVLRIRPLSLPAADATTSAQIVDLDAVRLFCDRANEAADAFALTDGNAAAVARICRRLDGSPLALELAASRIRLLSAQQLADRLDHRFALLADGPRTADPRHQTLQAAIDWSYDLLPEVERVVLRRLAAFPADFDLDAAEAVVAGDDALPGPPLVEILGLLGRLVDKSLVVAEQSAVAQTVRYHLLESVREYAALRLAEAGETEAAHRRHRDFFVAAGDWYAEPLHSRWLQRARAEADNLRAAATWSAQRDEWTAVAALIAQQHVYWWLAGPADAVEWLQRALAHCDGATRDGIHLRIGLSNQFLVQGTEAKLAQWEVLIEEAIALSAAAGDDVMSVWSELVRAQVRAASGYLDEADEWVRDIERRYPHRPPNAQAFGHYLRTSTAMARGDVDAARAHGNRVLAATPVDDRFLQAQALAALAVVEAVAGEATLAARYAREAIDAARQVPGARLMVMVLTRGVESAVLGGRAEDSLVWFDELLVLLRELGSPVWVAEALELTAMTVAAGEPDTAALLLGAAIGTRGLLREEHGVLAVLAERLAACRRDVVARLGEADAAERQRHGASLHLADALVLARDAIRRVEAAVPV